LTVVVVHNWAEAGFVGLSFPFFVFFLIAIDYPAFAIASSPASLEATTAEEEIELVYRQQKSYMASRTAI